MLDGKELEEAIAARPGEKVELQDILGSIKEKHFMTLEAIGCPTVTICNLTLNNGYSVRGESACVDPENYCQEIGNSIAYKNAVNKLWPLFGFLLAEARYLRDKVKVGAGGTAMIFLLLLSGCSTLFPVEETKYLHMEDGSMARIDLQNGEAFQTRKVYEIQRVDTQKVIGHWVCTDVPATNIEHCIVRQIKN